ncbi:hypothetical protein GCM10029964_061370 [Kibdelosporangium lantanae]
MLLSPGMTFVNYEGRHAVFFDNQTLVQYQALTDFVICQQRRYPSLVTDLITIKDMFRVQPWIEASPLTWVRLSRRSETALKLIFRYANRIADPYFAYLCRCCEHETPFSLWEEQAKQNIRNRSRRRLTLLQLIALIFDPLTGSSPMSNLMYLESEINRLEAQRIPSCERCGKQALIAIRQSLCWYCERIVPHKWPGDECPHCLERLTIDARLLDHEMKPFQPLHSTESQYWSAAISATNYSAFAWAKARLNLNPSKDDEDWLLGLIKNERVVDVYRCRANMFQVSGIMVITTARIVYISTTGSRYVASFTWKDVLSSGLCQSVGSGGTGVYIATKTSNLLFDKIRGTATWSGNNDAQRVERLIKRHVGEAWRGASPFCAS